MIEQSDLKLNIDLAFKTINLLILRIDALEMRISNLEKEFYDKEEA